MAGARSGSSTDGDSDRIIHSNTKVRGEQVVHVPLHLTEKILSCISLRESARLATVCKSWAATVSARLAIPHLFVYTPRDVNPDRRGLIVSVVLDGSIGAAARLPLSAMAPARLPLKDTRGQHCIGATSSGRLAFTSWWRLSLALVNPVTGGVWQATHVRQQLRRVVLSGGGRGGDDSFVYSKSNNNNELLLNWRDDDGGDWTNRTVRTSAQQMDSMMSAVNCNGCFYLLHKNGDVCKIDTTVPSPLLVEAVPAVEGLIDDDDQFIIPPATYCSNGHLLESDGEILFVRRLLASKEVALPCKHRGFESINVGFEVYKLDVKDQRWDKVEKLDGDRALFVSPYASFAVRASETVGCMSNCIYFISKKRFCSFCQTDAWGVYSLEDHKVLFEYVFTDPIVCSAAMWFFPSVV